MYTYEVPSKKELVEIKFVLQGTRAEYVVLSRI
jgi:hypothetical protein